jgi:hypothetical protein
MLKLCNLKESIMSMADVHGIASEVFSHGSSIISIKSDDVYSYT